MKPLSRENFIEHLAKSSTAFKLGINNEIPSELMANAKFLFNHYRLITDKLGFPDIYITSGYRCLKLNKAVGGVPGSKHCRCLAFDFVFPNVVKKSDFLNSFNQLRENFCVHCTNARGFSAITADNLFKKHFISYPERLFVHTQINYVK